MPTPLGGDSDLVDVFTAMAALEGPFFAAINPAFTALDFMPPSSQTDQLYPFSFGFPPEWDPNERAESGGSAVLFTYTISRVILVGLSSNDFGDLTREAAKYIIPFHRLYRANRSISGTVRNVHFTKGYMGDIEFNNVKHYGIQFPLIVEQRLYLPSHLL